MRVLIAIVLMVFSLNSAWAQQDSLQPGEDAFTKALRSQTWYDATYAKPVPTTLKDAIAADKEQRGNTPDYSMQGSKEVCAALHEVKVPCDYGTRWNLTMFLTINGKMLFPAAGNTNPYYAAEDRAGDPEAAYEPDDVFIGEPVQNHRLAIAVLRNKDLFHGGDITAEEVQKNWR